MRKILIVSFTMLFLYAKTHFMSEKANQLIEKVREKATLLHNQLLAERSENRDIQVEIVKLKAQLEAKIEEIDQLNKSINDLKNEIRAKSEQHVNSSVRTMASEEEIDELVKEIEYCIAQLKK